RFSLRPHTRRGRKYVFAGGHNSARPDMGYFDGLTSSSFKTGQDGRKLFFPWGAMGRGYTIESERDYERLRSQVKSYIIVSFVLIIASSTLSGNLVALVVAGLVMGFYFV